MAVAFVSRSQDIGPAGSTSPGAHAAASAGDLLVRLVIAFSSSASLAPPSGYTTLQSGNLSAFGSGAPGKYALYGKIAAGGETGSDASSVSTGDSVAVEYVMSGAHTTLASAVSAFNMVTEASFADDSWPTVAGATATISKNGSAAIFGAWAEVQSVSAPTNTGTFAPPNEAEEVEVGGATSTGYSTGLSIGTTTAYPVSGDPGGGSIGRRGTYVIVIRPANTAPTAPAAIVSPADSSTHGAGTSDILVLDGTTGTDTEGDTLQTEWQLSRDNGATWPYSTGLGALDTTLDISAVPATTAAKVRVRHNDGTVDGPWLTQAGTFTIEHDSPHAAATPLSPVGGADVDRTNVILTWQPNPATGGSAQTKADIRYRTTGSGVWTTVTNAVTTATSYAIPSTLAVDEWEWQVLTYNALDDPAAGWSASAIFDAANVPNAPTITSHAVDDVIGTSTDLLEWTGVGDSIRVRVLGDLAGSPDTGNVIDDSGTVTPGVLSWPLEFPDNNVTRHLQVMRTVGGLDSAWATVRVDVDYDEPATPSHVATESTPGALTVTITNPAPSGSEPDLDHNDLYRREGGAGDGIRVAADLPDGGSFTDWAVASGVTYEYRVRAFGDNGTQVDGAWG